MTLLGRYNRRQDTASMKRLGSPVNKGKLGYSKPKPSTAPIPSPIDRHRTDRDGPFEPVSVSKETMKAIESAVRNLNIDLRPCPVSAIANALSDNRKVRQMHSSPTERNPLNRLTKQLRKFSLRNGKFRSDEEAMKRKYEITRAFNRLERLPTSISKRVSSWGEAKEALREVIRFPSEGEDHEEGADKETNVDLAAKFAKAMDDVYRSEETENLEPYDSMWRKISAIPIPGKLSDSEQAIDTHRTAMEKADNMFRLRLVSATEELEERQKSEALKQVEERLKQKELQDEAQKKASSLMRPLSKEEKDLVAGAIFGRSANTSILAQCDADSVQQGSMHTLQPGQWVNDEVIHYFLLMLAKRDEEMCTKDPNRKRSHFFKSFFITKILNEGHATLHGKYEYKNVKRWSKKVPGKDLFKLDKVFFPINQGSMHWLCACAFITEKRIEVYDSMGSSGQRYLDCIFQYLQDDHLDKKGTPLPDLDKWELVPCRENIPQQRNGYDCGVFACMYIDFVSKDCPIVFTQDHVNQCRERIAMSILNGKAIM